MSLSTYLQFLIGRRHAIQRLSDARGALDVGLIFVLTAGLAREYDGEDLLHEPWHALLPLGVSLAASLLLYLVIALVAWVRGLPVNWRRRSYRRLLVCYWLMAPMAWLYAIPFERFLKAEQAVQANLWILAIVSTWRVLLMTRCVALLYRFRTIEAFWPVMLFADTVALAAINLMPLPIIDIMAGIRQTPSEQVLAGTALLVQVLAVLTFPLWLIGTIVVCATGRTARRPEWERPGAERARERLPRRMWWLAVCGLAVWALILPQTQPQQIHRHWVEKWMRSGRVQDALVYMSTMHQDDFPPHWSPPPRLGYGETNPSLLEVLEMAQHPEVAPWVRRIYGEKYAFHYEHDWRGYPRGVNLLVEPTPDLRRHVAVLETITVGPEIAATYVEEIDRLLNLDPPHPDPNLNTTNPERRQLFERLRALAE